MESGSQRRFVGGADPLPRNRWDEDERRRWESDPVWQASKIAPGAELADAATAAEWPVNRLTSYTQRQGRGPAVRDLIPDDFDAYLRVLFPVFEPPPRDQNYVENLLTWHETALRNDRQPHRLMDLVGIGPDHDDVLHGGTHVPQTLASTQEAALISILENHTPSEQSVFVLWYGDYNGRTVIPTESLIEVDQGPSSPYGVFSGPHRAWKDFWSYPRWWPEDRSWCWQTGLDLDMTNCAYLGTSHLCAEEIFASTVIEAVVAQPDDPVFSTDTINRPPPK